MARRQRRNNGDWDFDSKPVEDGGEEEVGAPLNSSARSEIIREAHETISDYEKQIDGLKAEIKAVVETRIVAGLGMKKRDFALARKLVALDHDERDHLQDSIRECFAALGVGQQLNWLDATEGERADA